MLTGDIKINGHTIGAWKAHNIGGSQAEGELQSYKVNVEYTNKDGYHQVAEFYLHHPYSRDTGALTLAARILSEAPAFLHRPLLSEEGYTEEHFGRLLG